MLYFVSFFNAVIKVCMSPMGESSLYNLGMEEFKNAVISVIVSWGFWFLASIAFGLVFVGLALVFNFFQMLF